MESTQIKGLEKVSHMMGNGRTRDRGREREAQLETEKEKNILTF